MREIWLERYTVLQGSQTAHVIEGVSIGLRDIRFYKALKPVSIDTTNPDCLRDIRFYKALKLTSEGSTPLHRLRDIRFYKALKPQRINTSPENCLRDIRFYKALKLFMQSMHSFFA